MTQSHSNVRLAIAQMPMHWTCEANTSCILENLAAAADQGAQICVFPELALTGFHRQTKTEAEPVRIAGALQRIQALCQERAISCVVGATTFENDSAPLNSHVYIDLRGKIAATVSKIGLTPSEATFFATGLTRPVVSWPGMDCTSVLCREMEDLDVLQTQLPAGKATVIFWPSYIGRNPNDPPGFAHRYRGFAQRLARQSEAYVIQCNWPHALNSSDITYMGGSAVISPLGEVLFGLPIDQSGLATFLLGEREYAWSASHVQMKDPKHNSSENHAKEKPGQTPADQK
jgi:predicted amidohydrolase